MRLGMVGLGKMGANMALRLMRGEHEVVAFDVDPAAVAVPTAHITAPARPGHRDRPGATAALAAPVECFSPSSSSL